MRAVLTAADVYAKAQATYPRVGARELGRVYAQLAGEAWPRANRWALMPEPMAGMAVVALLRPALHQAGSGPGGVLRVRFHDPQCGVGTCLVVAARALAREYATRLCGARADDEVIAAVLPGVILHCVFGTDGDSLAVQLARLALSLETGGLLPAQALDRHIVWSGQAGDIRPSALDDRPGVQVLATAGRG